MVEENWLLQVKNSVSRKDPSKTRPSFFPYLQIKPYGVRRKSRNIFSSQNGNAATHFLRSSLLRVVSTLGFFVDGEVVAAGTYLSELFCGDIVYELCRVMMVQNPF